jgi:hypothetical protein
MNGTAKPFISSGRGGLYSDTLLQCSGIQRGVHRYVAASLNRDVLLDKRAKTYGFHAYGVRSWIHEVEDIQARSICLFSGLHAGVDITKRDGGGGQSRP